MLEFGTQCVPNLAYFHIGLIRKFDEFVSDEEKEQILVALLR
jgi:hypothetical protein